MKMLFIRIMIKESPIRRVHGGSPRRNIPKDYPQGERWIGSVGVCAFPGPQESKPFQVMEGDG